MAVVIINTYKVHPGRRQDFLRGLGESKRLVERRGGKVRAWSSDLSGAGAGNISVVQEFEDYAAWARFHQEFASDADYQSVVARIQGDTDPPVALLSRASATEPPL